VEALPLDSTAWAWEGPTPVVTEHLGRECVRVENAVGIVTGPELLDGVVELELAVGRERGFHGVVWRAADHENLESFFVRPHQVGNPDAGQYAPAFNGITGFQLYHGPGYWAPLSFPIDEWFRVRVAFAGARAEFYVGDLDEPALAVGELERPPLPGGVGLFTSLAPVHVSSFALHAGDVTFRHPAPAPAGPVAGIVPAWSVSEPFAEDALAGVTMLDDRLLADRTWSELASRPSGLVDLARHSGVKDGRNTVFARTVVRSDAERTAELAFGFSDRVAVYLNRRLLYRGDDAYRSRDYRFLGSIGYFDRLYLPLRRGENELVLAVSEDLGGWGAQATLDA